MTDCVDGAMRDVLPDLVHGRLETAERVIVEEHVAACEECAAELELIRSVAAAMPIVESQDVTRIVAALPSPVVPRSAAPAEAGVSGSREMSMLATWLAAPGFRAAAVAVLVLAAGAVLLDRDREAVSGPSQGEPAPVTSTASSDAAVSQVAVTTGEPGGAASARPDAPSGISLVAGVQELSEEHIAMLLDEVDELDAISADDSDFDSSTY